MSLKLLLVDFLSNKIYTLMRVLQRYKSSIGLALVSFIIVVIYSNAGSPLYVSEGGDGTIFKIMGLGVLQGKIPYHNLFDHKGPLIFYIFALAQIMGHGKWGLFFLQVIFLFVSLLCHWSISRRFLSTKQTVVSTAVVCAFIAILMDDGAQCEFFELPLIYISVLLAVKYIYETKRVDFKYISFFVGLCCGVVAMIRVNDAALLIGVLYLSMLLYSFRHHKDNLVRGLLLFVLANVIVISPFFIYFYAKGILSDAWYGIFGLNFKYLDTSKINNLNLKFLLLSLFLMSSLLAFKRHGDNRINAFIILPIILISFFLIGNAPYYHYYLIMAPIITLLLTQMFNKYYVAMLSWIFVFSGWNVGGGTPPFNGSLLTVTYQHHLLYRDNVKLEKKYSDYKRLIEQVPADQKNQIWAYNFDGLDMYANLKITPGNIFFVWFHRTFDPEIETKEDVFKEMPLWVLSNALWQSADDMTFFDANYENMGEVNGRVLYKRKGNESKEIL